MCRRRPTGVALRLAAFVPLEQNSRWVRSLSANALTCQPHVKYPCTLTNLSASKTLGRWVQALTPTDPTSVRLDRCGERTSSSGGSTATGPPLMAFSAVQHLCPCHAKHSMPGKCCSTYLYFSTGHSFHSSQFIKCSLAHLVHTFKVRV